MALDDVQGLGVVSVRFGLDPVQLITSRIAPKPLRAMCREDRRLDLGVAFPPRTRSRTRR
jgi:hypothetical protein